MNLHGKKSILLFGLSILSGILMAQTTEIKGKVADEKTLEPLPYVNIGVKDQLIGTFSDSNGSYRLELPKGKYTLIFSSVGYDKLEQEITLSSRKTMQLDILLKSTSQELNTIVVSASKYAQKIQESISSIEVLKPNLIQNNNIQSAEKAIDRVPGVSIVDNEPQIRAGSGFSSGLGSRVMIMVDEIPILRGDAGRPSWNILPIDDLEQIEVVKGASSVIYGSSAINGAINLRTAWPKDAAETKLNTFLGMYSKPYPKYSTPWSGMNPMVYGISCTHSQKIGNVDLVAGVGYYNDHGYIGGVPENKSVDTLYNKGQFDKRYKFYFNTRVRSKKIEGLSYGLNGNLLYSENAQTYFWYDADTNIYRSFPGALTLFKEFDFYADPFVRYFNKNGDSHSLKNRVFYTSSDATNNQSSQSVTVYDEYQYTHAFKKLGGLILVTGVMNTYVYAFGKVFSGTLASDGTPTAGLNGKYTSENFAVYAQAEKKFFNKLTILFGGRYEYYNLSDLTDHRPVFRAGLNFRAAQGTFLRASAGQGFRFPSIGERYITTNSGNFGFYPNPKLRPEYSINYEVGAKQLFKFGKFAGMADIAGFYEDYQNYVEFNFGSWGGNHDPSKDIGFKFFNTGPARIYGVDLTAVGEGNVTRSLNLTVMVGYTYAIPQSTDPHYVFYQTKKLGYKYINTSSDTNGFILKYRVQSVLKSDVQLTWKRFSGGFGGRYFGFMKNIDKFFYDFLDGEMFGVNTGIKKYREEHNKGTFILDFRLSYSFRDFKFAAIVNNLLNTQFSLRPLTVEPPRMTQLQVVYKI